MMPFRKCFVLKPLALAAVIFCCFLASAKDKKKALLPADVLQARTVLVIIDPTAGVDAADPYANRLARMDVEKALDLWGRFTLVQEGFSADLVITVRKGNGKVIQPTIGGTPVNGNPPINAGSASDPNQATTRAGGHWGTSSMPNDPSANGTQSSAPYPQIEAGPVEDTFIVYRGNKDDPHWNPLDAPAVWRYSRKDALASPAVPAVEVFRTLIADSEKQLASHP
jgi:hypothetical protein